MKFPGRSTIEASASLPTDLALLFFNRSTGPIADILIAACHRIKVSFSRSWDSPRAHSDSSSFKPSFLQNHSETSTRIFCASDLRMLNSYPLTLISIGSPIGAVFRMTITAPGVIPISIMWRRTAPVLPSPVTTPFSPGRSRSTVFSIKHRSLHTHLDILPVYSAIRRERANCCSSFKKARLPTEET